MVPILPPGTLIIANRWVSRLKPGDVILFPHNYKERIRRIKSVKNETSLVVISEYHDTGYEIGMPQTVNRSDVTAKVIYPSVKPRV